MARVWLNHWFSTAYNIIELIKANNPGFEVVGTNERMESPIRAKCDEWFQEPVLKGRDYVNYCLEFCVDHHIDVFMPRRHMVEISKHKEEFEAQDIKVMVDDYRYVQVLNSKDKAYSLFDIDGLDVVPPHYVVNNVEDFVNAYRVLKQSFKQVCFKFVRDEGGKSYRLIDNSRKGYEALFKRQTTRMTFDDAVASLSEKTPLSPLMVMPYLPGNEVSVDCLRTSAGTIAIPRVKDSSRVERVLYDEAILSKCDELLEIVPLDQPCNIQFKYLDNRLYFLEINTRMSGGIHMSCAASGVNVPSIAVNKLLGVEEAWHLDATPRTVTQVEIPILL